MADAFISYRRDPSAPQAMLVQTKLQYKHQIDAYVDTTRTDSTRVQFPQRLMQAIADAPTFILMLADTTLESEWVRKEIQQAYELRKHCIPVFQESYKHTHISDPAIEYVLSFDGVHLLDKKNIYIDEAIQQIANLVVKSSEVQPPPIVVTPQKPQIAIPPKPKIILPQPFDWCYIPAGRVVLTTDVWNKKPVDFYLDKDTPTDVIEFFIAKYPVTNEQYLEFLKANDGYELPDKWNDNKLKLNHPVVGVIWSDVVAFCQWLSEKSGQTIILPSDAQWQHASQGDDGNKYPWGNDFDANKCNTKESNVGQTTPVTQYPNGASPFGVLDMSGNVWEYCSTHYKHGNDRQDRGDKRILRGGSYHDDESWCVTTKRIYTDNDELRNKGFRIACQIDST